MKSVTIVTVCLLLVALGGCAVPQAVPEEPSWMDLITVTVKKVDAERPATPEPAERRAVQAGGS